MTSKEFVLWLQGFAQGAHEHNILPKQWDVLKDKLAEVNDEHPIGIPIGEGGLGVPNTQPFPIWQELHTYYTNKEIPCVTPNGTSPSPSFVVTTSPGTTISTTSGSSISTIITPNGTTSTTYGYPPGGAWSYTSDKKD